jgi:hypothetical protein
VTTLWIPKSKKLSEKVKELGSMCAHTFTDYHARFLMKYPHSTQDKLTEVFSVKKKVGRKRVFFWFEASSCRFTYATTQS